MTPIISPWVFYVIGVADTLKIILAFVSIIIAVWIFVEALDSVKPGGKILTALAVFTALAIFVPTSKTVEKMVVAQNVTYERVEVVSDTVQTVYRDIMELFEEDD